MFSAMGKVSHVSRELIGATGRRYCFKELLQDRPQLGRVWVATHGRESFVLKDISQNILAHFNERIWPQLRQNSSALLRLPIDTIPGRPTLVYQHLMHDFLDLVRLKPPMHIRRQVLKTTLQAIAELHDRDVVHLDVKPDNIIVDYEQRGALNAVGQVMIIDLEDAAHLPKGRCIKGMLAGNENWRSPEAHFKGELSKPSDMFSFGLVCLYALFGRVICGPDEDFKKHEAQGALPAAIRLQRLVSCFGDRDGLNGLMKHVGDEEINCQILSMLWEERDAKYIQYKPFSEWPEAKHDEMLRDLIKGLMNLDPSKRTTASQTLAHPWFASEIELTAKTRDAEDKK